MGILAQSVVERKADAVESSLDLFRRLGGWLNTKSGASVNHKTALEVSVVLACARVIAEGIAQVPFKLYRQEGDRKLPATDHPLYRVLYRKPNDWMTSFELRETMAIHAVLTGNAVAFVNRLRGEVREIIPITPGNVTIKQRDDYSLIYTVTGPSGAQQDYPQEAIWHWRGPSWDSVVGLDIVKLAREAIGLTMAAEQTQARMQKSGASMTGLYSVDGNLTDDQYRSLRRFLDKEFASETAERVKLLDRGAKFTPISMTGVDAQQLETRKYQVEEVCRPMRVMPIMVGYSDKAATYASAEQMFLAHVVHTLSPWYQRIEQSAECQLLSAEELDKGYFVKLIAAGLMRGSHKDRGEFYAKALGAGGSRPWMTPDDVRDLEDMNPMGGDAARLLDPVNLGGATPTKEEDEDNPKEDEDGKPDL